MVVAPPSINKIELPIMPVNNKLVNIDNDSKKIYAASNGNNKTVEAVQSNEVNNTVTENPSKDLTLAETIIKGVEIISDFNSGVTSGIAETYTLGVSSNLDKYYDRENETAYQLGKISGSVYVAAQHGTRAISEGGMAIETAPTGIGAVYFSYAAVADAGIAASAARTAAVGIYNFATGSGGNDPIDQSGKELNIDKIDDKYLKRNGIDAHELKKDVYGKKAKVAEYDIYVDKNTGELYTQRKPQYNKAGEAPTPTGEFIK